MSDCTRIRVLALVLTGVLLAFPALAGADGDPASDVLASQPLFLPQDADVPSGQYAQLRDLVQAASRAGYQVRVAVVASETDLGSVTALWNQPQNYARFLGEELSLVYRGPLLVVMPAGYGVARAGGKPAGLAGLAPPGRQLGPAAIVAIRRLAAAAGHPLAVSAVRSPSGPGSGDAIAWIVFAAGSVVILVAWAASFRARPPQLPPRARA